MKLDRDIINAEMESMNGFTSAECSIEVFSQEGLCNAIIMPFLCGNCDHVHLTVQSEAGVAMHFTLSQEGADRLANGLMSPSALHRDLLENSNESS